MEFRYYDWIDYHARYTPTKVAIVDLETKRRLTYVELSRRSNQLARWLKAKGVAQGDRVSILSKSCPEAFQLQFACAKIGAIFLPLNWRLAVPELEFILSDAQPTALLLSTDIPTGRLLSRKHAIPSVEFGGSADAEFAALLDGFDDTPAQLADVDMEDVWAMLYTSGTTGNPKAAMLSYRMVVANALNFSFPIRATIDSVFLCAMPTFHTGGLNVYANPILHAGGTVLIMRDFDPEVAVSILSDAAWRVTHFFGTPSHYLFMSQQPAFEHARFPTLVNVGVGGAAPTANMIEEWLDKGAPIQPTYGMTEIGPGVLTTDHDRVREKLGTAGRPVLHMDLAIMDGDGNELPRGQVGEICVRGPSVMSGYWQRPEANEASFRNGWFRSGDAAYQDSDGYVFIVDRLREMFISGGENVYPAEIEKVLSTMPEITMSAVVGVPDQKWGEVGRAFVVLKPGAQLSEHDIRKRCERLLAKYKVPKSVIFTDALPQTASGKVQKHALREWNVSA